MSTVQEPRAAARKSRKTVRASRGSRSGSETRKPSKIVHVRYPLQEYTELESQAERSGVTLSAYVRQKTSAIRPERKKAKSVTARQKLAGRYLAQLGKIGSNLNQLARAANMDLAGVREFEAALQEIHSLGNILRMILRGDA